MALKFCSCTCHSWVRQFILLSLTLASFLETTYFGLWFACEMTDRLPSLKPYSSQRWLSLVIIIFSGFTLILACLAYETAFGGPRNIPGYQKVIPFLLISAATFFIFGFATSAIYLGVETTPLDFFTSLQETRGTGRIHYQTDDGFEIPLWLDDIQRRGNCCGIQSYMDYDRRGQLNDTMLRRSSHTSLGYPVPASCCIPPAQKIENCGDFAFELSNPGIFQDGCLDHLQEEINELVAIGTAGNFILAILSLLAFFSLIYSRRVAINKFVAERSQRIGDGYNPPIASLLEHLVEIYMDSDPQFKDLT